MNRTLRPVEVIGIGQTDVGEHWHLSLSDLARQAVWSALDDARLPDGITVGAIIVGNMASSRLARQENLGAVVADQTGLVGVEAIKIEAACAAGGAALRIGKLMVESGSHDVVVVVGVEKMTDATPDVVNSQLGLAADPNYEAIHGVTFAALNALLTQLYVKSYGYKVGDFAAFPMNAHANARHNLHAMFRKGLTISAYRSSSLVSSPITVLDSAPVCDGAAAVVLAASGTITGSSLHVRFAASASATDTVALTSRPDPLWLEAVSLSMERALTLAGIHRRDVDLFEVHDAFPVMAALSLEASGFVERGTAVRAAGTGDFGLRGRLPIQTMGGLKARGHPIGATGVYQAVEVCQQLRGVAGTNQLERARIAVTQNIGGLGTNVFTSVFITTE